MEEKLTFQKLIQQERRERQLSEDFEIDVKKRSDIMKMSLEKIKEVLKSDGQNKSSGCVLC